MKTLILYIALGVFPFLASAQTLTYKVTWKGDSIGYLRAEKDKSGPFVTYELKSETAFSFLLSYSMLTKYHSVYKDGRLLNASSNNFVNDKQKGYSKITFLKDSYKIEVNKEVRTEAFNIDESISTLYFDPPKKSSIFSERHGILCDIRNMGNGAFDLVKPDDRINTYYYRNGICERVKIHLALATIELQKIN